MFNHLFVNTRSSIDHIHKQLLYLSRAISLSTQALFMGYYVYLICISTKNTGFLIAYISLLVLSLATFILDIFFIFKKGETRLEKRMNVERKRRFKYILMAVRVLLKIAVIVLSGVELVKYPASEMQIITFTLSIVLLVFYLAFNTLIFIINKDIDLIRLSFESDIASSKILSKLMRHDEKEYTEQEHHLLDGIKERAKSFLERKKK